MSLKEIPSEIENELAKYPPLTKRLLFNRGVMSAGEADAFLSPMYERDIHDPFLMMNLEQGVDQIYAAIKAGEKICIFADYDCDGIPGAVMWDDFFRKIKFPNYQIYIPDRHKEGYGLGIESIKEIYEGGAKLLVTLDLGITAVEEVQYAKTLGLPIIITDHHLPQEKVPDTLIINPKQKGDTYPDNMLCGSGVALKVIQGFIKKYGAEFEIPVGFDKWLLDMAGLATLADMVPLRYENRAIAYYGLKVLRKTRRPGLLRLLRKVNIESQNLQEDDVTFSICPKLNAASRMDSPMRAFELLSASDEPSAALHADHLIKINDERKLLVAHIMKSVKKTFSHTERVEKNVIVIGDPTWRVGVLGLVAGKIVEEFKRPAFVWGLEGGETIKGSCRSDGTTNLVEMMAHLPEGSLLDFGGHAGAGGFSVSHEEIHFLEERLIDAHAKTKKIVLDNEEKDFDANLSLDEVNARTFMEIDRLAPFGVGNPKPIFMFQDIQIDEVKIFGKAKDHLELSFRDSRGGRVKAISFFKKPEDYGDKIVVGNKISLLANIEKSIFGWKQEIRLRIVDIV